MRCVRLSWLPIALAAAMLLSVALALTPVRAHAESPVDVPNGTASAGAMPTNTRMTPNSRPNATPNTPGANAATSYSVKGIDVASHQGSVNWAKVAGAGYQFAYAKATEGTDYINPYFDEQYNGAKNAGLFAGAYVFARPDGNAKTQADYFYSHAQFGRDGRTLPLMLDMEGPYGSLTDTYNKCWNKNKSQMVSWIRTFVDRIHQRSGSHMLIYTNYYWWQDCTGNSAAFSDQLLNIANWSSGAPLIPASWTTWTIRQYSDSGTVAGVSGNVDLDAFNGNREQLKQLALADWVTSGVSAVRAGSQFHIFGHNAHGQLLQLVWTGRKWLEQNLGGVTVGAPGVTYHSGRYDVFAVNRAGSLYQRTFAGRWSSWHKIASGWATSGVSAVWTGGSEYHVFGHDANGRLLQLVWTGKKWLQQNLGGTTTGTPAVIYHSGRYDVFAVTAAGSVYQRTFARHWSSWHKIGSGWTASGLTAVWTGSAYRVYGHVSSGRIVQLVWSGNGWAQHSLSGVTTGTPAVAYHSGRYDVFAVNKTGALYQRTYTGSDWTRWHMIA